jgi:hypothetical protein
LEKIKYELAEDKKKQKDSAYKSHAADSSKCFCSIRINFLIPCRHLLRDFDVIPLDAVHQRWRINYSLDGRGMFIRI